MILIVEILLLIAMAGLIHELGHFIIALGYGHFLRFEFSWGHLWRIPIPRYIWYMPEELSVQNKRHVALAGFGAEFLVAPILYFLLPYYPLIAFLHLMAYPFYAGGSSDFQWLDGFAGISRRGWMWIDILVLCGAFWYGVYKILTRMLWLQRSAELWELFW